MMRIFYLFFLVFLVGACNTANKADYLPGYSGQVGEVIVVCSKNEWNGDLGKVVRGVLAQPSYGLPQDEPLFDLIQVSPTSFKNVLSTHRNVVSLEVHDTVAKPVLDFKKSKYAKGQLFVSLRANTKEKLIELIATNQQGLISLFQRAELNRTIRRNKKYGPAGIEKKVKKTFGVNLILQKGMELRVEEDNFFWIRLERERPVGGYKHQISQGILIASLPYRARTDFLDSLVLQVKDSINKARIKGPTKGSYMTTDYEFVPPIISEIELAQQYVKEIRGLWRMENNYMGGPFVSVITAHPKEDKLIYVEGYVFAPQFNKREYLREVEAVVKSISFP